MPFLDKAPDGTRRFKDSDFQWLKTITCLKNTGMSIHEIRDFVALCMEGDATLNRRLAIMKDHQARFEQKMAQMQLYQETIRSKIRYYEDAVAAGTENRQPATPSQNR